jgi:1-acyl-sn-glycerol-3-phosphate acyltransferase
MFWWPRVLLAAALSAIYWGLGAVGFLVLSWTVGWALPVRWSRAVGQRLLHVAFAGFILLLRTTGMLRIEFRGFELWQRGLQGQILAPNHPALWDAVLIMGRLPGLTCILKTGLLRNPLLMGGARLARFIPGSPTLDMVRQSVTAVRGGQNLLLFPEATRTRLAEGPLNELRGGIGIIAHQTMAPIWPVVVRTDSSYLSKGWPVWRLPSAPVTVSITLSPPLKPMSGQSAHDIVGELQRVFLTLLSPPFHELAHPHPELQHRA